MKKINQKIIKKLLKKKIKKLLIQPIKKELNILLWETGYVLKNCYAILKF